MADEEDDYDIGEPWGVVNLLSDRLLFAGRLTAFDWKAGDDAVRNQLQVLPCYPADLDWEWYGDLLREREREHLVGGEATEQLLEWIGERGYAIGQALVSLDTLSDSYAVGFMPVARAESMVAAAPDWVKVIRKA